MAFMQESSCLVINPIMVDNFDALFNCTPVDQASDSMTATARTRVAVQTPLSSVAFAWRLYDIHATVFMLSD